MIFVTWRSSLATRRLCRFEFRPEQKLHFANKCAFTFGTSLWTVSFKGFNFLTIFSVSSKGFNFSTLFFSFLRRRIPKCTFSICSLKWLVYPKVFPQDSHSLFFSFLIPSWTLVLWTFKLPLLENVLKQTSHWINSLLSIAVASEVKPLISEKYK